MTTSRKQFVRDYRAFMDHECPGWRECFTPAGRQVNVIEVEAVFEDGSGFHATVYMRGGFEGERVEGMDYDDVDW